jgi:hypothetical protein
VKCSEDCAKHRKLFDLQGEAIAGLREALNAVSRTHDEMMALFELQTRPSAVESARGQARLTGPGAGHATLRQSAVSWNN